MEIGDTCSYNLMSEPRVINLQKKISLANISPLPPVREKLSKYGVLSGPHFPIFGLNTQFTKD